MNELEIAQHTADKREAAIDSALTVLLASAIGAGSDLDVTHVDTLVTIGKGMFWSHELDEAARKLAKKANDKFVDIAGAGGNTINEAKSIEPFKDVFVIVAERDTSDWLRSNGAIVFEQYTHDLPCKVLERARSLKSYGKLMICRLEPVGDVDEFGAMLERKI